MNKSLIKIEKTSHMETIDIGGKKKWISGKKSKQHLDSKIYGTDYEEEKWILVSIPGETFEDIFFDCWPFNHALIHSDHLVQNNLGAIGRKKYLYPVIIDVSKNCCEIHCGHIESLYNCNGKESVVCYIPFNSLENLVNLTTSFDILRWNV